VRTKEKLYLSGETIHLEVAVSDTRSGQPVDPTSVVLKRLRQGITDLNVFDRTFIRRNQGDYSYMLSTEGLASGIYDVLIEISGVEGVALLSDRFVLRAP
jgi:hypothetical protein